MKGSWRPRPLAGRLSLASHSLGRGSRVALMANSPAGEAVIERIVRVLESFDSRRTALTVAQIARRAELPRSTGYRLVNDLVAHGLLERDAQGQITIGLRLWELALRGSPALGLRQAAQPFMSALNARIRQHTQLGVLEGTEVLFIERLSAPGASANITKIAGRLPVNASSSGLVLLAWASPEQQATALAGPLPSYTRLTPNSAEALRALLPGIRRSGFAVASGYIEEISTGIAVPVFDAAGRCIAALSVVLPREGEGPIPTQAAIVAALKQTAAEIRAALPQAHGFPFNGN